MNLLLNRFELNMFNPLPHDKILRLPKLKAFTDNKLNVTQDIKVSFIGWKTLWEKKKMLVTSIFFFSHNVFKSLFPPAHQKSSLCGKRLTL